MSRTACTSGRPLAVLLNAIGVNHHVQVLIWVFRLNDDDVSLRLSVARTGVDLHSRVGTGTLNLVAHNFTSPLKREKDKFERQREKLMEAHYAGAIPVDLLGREQERISRSLREIEARTSATLTEFETVEENLARALDLAGDCGAAYEEAPDHIKRMFNQAFFEKVFVVQIDESLAGVEIDAKLREPFDVLLGDELRAASNSSTADLGTKKPADKTANGLSSTTSRTPFQVKGLSNALMVEVRGFEPLTS